MALVGGILVLCIIAFILGTLVGAGCVMKCSQKNKKKSLLLQPHNIHRRNEDEAIYEVVGEKKTIFPVTDDIQFEVAENIAYESLTII